MATRKRGALMSMEVYLAIVEEPALWDTTEQVLVVFLRDAEEPPERLVDPVIVGVGSAEGIWDLLLWHPPSRRAFYEENREIKFSAQQT
jgi:hypothetical protein